MIFRDFCVSFSVGAFQIEQYPRARRNELITQSATVIPVIDRNYVNRIVRQFVAQEKKLYGRRFCRSHRQILTSRFPVTWFSTERAKCAFGNNYASHGFRDEHCLASGKWRESKNPPRRYPPRGFSTDPRYAISRIAGSANDPERTIYGIRKTERVTIVLESIAKLGI